MVVGASTLCFALGRSLPILLVARTLQGLSSAIVFTVGYALLFDLVGKKGIGTAMGYTGLSLSFGLLLGPVIGGTLYQYVGYFQVFLPAFAFIAVDILLRLMMVHETRIPPGLDPHKSSTTTLVPEAESGYGALPTQLHVPRIQVDTSSRVPSETEALLGMRQPSGFGSSLPVLLCSARFLVAVTGLFVLNSLVTGFDAVIPLYTSEAFGFNSMQAALLLLVLCVPMVLSPISGTVADRAGAKLPAACGFGVLTIGLFLLRLINPGIDLPFLRLAAVLFLIGLAVAAAMPPLMGEVSSAVDEIELANPGIFGVYGAYSQAYGLMNTTAAAGSLIGPLDAGFVREWLGWSTMSLLMTFIAFVTLILVLLVTGGYNFRR